VAEPGGTARPRGTRDRPARIALIRGRASTSTTLGPFPSRTAASSGWRSYRACCAARGARGRRCIRRLRARGLNIELLSRSDRSRQCQFADRGKAVFAHRRAGIEWLGRSPMCARVAPCGDRVLRRPRRKACPRHCSSGRLRPPLVAADVPGCARRCARRDRPPRAPHDVDALAAAIATLAADPGRRARMGQTGRALIEAQFTDEIVARETLALYRAAIRIGGKSCSDDNSGRNRKTIGTPSINPVFSDPANKSRQAATLAGRWRGKDAPEALTHPGARDTLGSWRQDGMRRSDARMTEESAYALDGSTSTRGASFPFPPADLNYASRRAEYIGESLL